MASCPVSRAASSPAVPVAYLVETGLPLESGAVPEWLTRSGYGTRESARREVRQLGSRWHRQGLRVRVREVPAGVTVTGSGVAP